MYSHLITVISDKVNPVFSSQIGIYTMDNSEKIIQLEAQINALKIKITELCIENTALRTENTELK